MNWMAKLCETYEQALLLEVKEDHRLLPISHTLQNAHIQVVIDGEGNFKTAKVLEKTQVILPATEKSAGRSSGEAPHPLADKLQYVAGDYAKYGGQKKAYFEGYYQQLLAWCQSDFRHPKAEAVRKYVEKQRLIEDLIAQQICYVDASNQLLRSWPFEVTESQPLPALFKTLPKEQGELDQGNALVCWSVEIPGDPQTETWNDQSLQESWIAFDAQNSGSPSLCFVSGQELPAATNHPAKLRHTGDKAKLVSANDNDGFTFRGRFTEGGQVAQVGFEITQKAHNALRWLISGQGSRNGDQVVVAWAVSGNKIPQPLQENSVLDLNDYGDENEEDEDLDPISLRNSLPAAPTMPARKLDLSVDLGERFGRLLKKYLAGYSNGEISKLRDDESILIMGLDSATPGRMGIIYFRDFMAKDYLKTFEAWHMQMAWPQRVTVQEESKGKKEKKHTSWIVSAPSPWNILQAAYSDIIKSSDTLKKSLYERLLPCIVEGLPLPVDLVQLAVNRASNPNNKEHWEWERDLGVTCALYRGFHHPDRQPDSKKRRAYSMSLDTANQSRDYLYGRLLALAEAIEETALRQADVNRPTTAARLMQRFSNRPYATWKTINDQLQPYLQQLQVRRAAYLYNRKKDLDEVMDLFNGEDFCNDKPLSGEYLLGFHCQRMAMRKRKDEDQPAENTEMTAVSE